MPKYILILGFTIIVDYLAGILMEKAANQRLKKLILICSLVSNIGVLAIFKYYNFFAGNFNQLLGHFLNHTHLSYLSWILPIGLSFHTFQAMSYTIEVYRGNHKAEKHFGIYSLYVMFYPQLVAGPIERPQNLLYQFHKSHTFDFEELKAGLMQMTFGFFKKVVIADRLAIIIDSSYAHVGSQNGKTLLITMVLYTFQIYCDFSGYTDIALGAAKTMGFTLIPNFNVPFSSANVTQFWRKWHMSLSSWFNDYLFSPLSFSYRNLGKLGIVLALLITFFISGLWHGAGWTFIIFGLLHGIAVSYEFLTQKFRKKLAKTIPSFVYQNVSVIITFLFVCFAWIFFRSPNVHIAFTFLKRIAGFSFSDKIDVGNNLPTLLFSIVLIILLIVKERFYLTIPTKKTVSFSIIFVSLLIACYIFGVFNNAQFIYFQF